MKPKQEPKGYAFYENKLELEMMLCYEGKWKDWILYKREDGKWIPLRKATGRDNQKILEAFSLAHHSEENND